VVIAVGGFLAIPVLIAVIWSLAAPQSFRGSVATEVAGLFAVSAFLASGWFLRRRHAWAWLSSLILLGIFVLAAGWLGFVGATYPEGDGQFYSAAGAIQAIAGGVFGIVQLLMRGTREDIKQGALTGRILSLPVQGVPPPPPPPPQI